MSRCYLDTNFLYAHLRDPRDGSAALMEEWRDRVVKEIANDSGVISALVIDEIAYRLVLAWLRDDGDQDPLSTYRRDPGRVMRAMPHRLAVIWRSIDSLELELEQTNLATVNQAKGLMSKPGLAPRDAFHAAHAIRASCSVIVSSDSEFDRLKEIRRVGPRAAC
ncbi:MAG: type II toxin-antitoxin system VapC family toxin [Candidatus Dormibacteraceae bacterium]